MKQSLVVACKIGLSVFRVWLTAIIPSASERLHMCMSMYVNDLYLIPLSVLQICTLMAEGLDPAPEHGLMSSTRQNGTDGGPSLPGQQVQPMQPVTPSKSQLELGMYAKIVASGLTVKSQQRGEPNLTHDQKVEILTSLLHQKPGAFLMRFGRVLSASDLVWFDDLMPLDYEVDYRVKELRKNLAMSLKSRENIVKNRRFEYLKELMDRGSYFSEEEMRNRNPLLFEHYVGQYLSEEERQQLDGSTSSDMTLSGMILKKMELDRRSELLSEQRDVEAGQIEESDSSSSSEDEEELEEDKEDLQQNLGMNLSVDPETAGREKWMLRQEFLRAMQLRFLSGEEKDFDYSKVDSNEEYDSIETRQRDEEDDYFDKEEPVLCEESHSNDRTGMECESVGTESEPDDYMTYEPPS